jgi:hypothetical protein
MASRDNSAALLGQVQDAFKVAVQLACGMEYIPLLENEAPVKLSTSWRKFGDMVCAFPKVFFTRLVNTTATDENSEMCITVSCISEFELKREMTYHSPRHVAESIISFIPEEVMGPLIASVNIMDGSNVLIVTTAAHMQWHLDNDRFPCSLCGRFCQGKYGIRTHQVSITLTTAISEVMCLFSGERAWGRDRGGS